MGSSRFYTTEIDTTDGYQTTALFFSMKNDFFSSGFDEFGFAELMLLAVDRDNYDSWTYKSVFNLKYIESNLQIQVINSEQILLNHKSPGAASWTFSFDYSEDGGLSILVTGEDLRNIRWVTDIRVLVTINEDLMV